MNFKPRTEKEIAESKLWPRGIYAFEVVEAADKQSQKSNRPMIELKIKVTDGRKAGRIVTDYLLNETPEKLRHAADACGLLDKYETGNVSGEDFLHKRGRLKLRIEKDKNGKYPDKNVVADYVCGTIASEGQGGFRVVAP